MLRVISLAACLATATAVAAQSDGDTHHRFNQLMDQAEVQGWHELPIGKVVRQTGLFFKDSPYTAGMLDVAAEELLVVDLTQFDCVLYVEAVLALAQGIAVQDYSYDGFADRLESMRYRQGLREGYCSRLHYFSEWIHDNDARGIVGAVTQEIGGQKLDKNLSFMSSHRDSYPRLLASDSLFSGIRDMEASLANLQLYHIPQARIRQAYAQLQDGDILGLSTHIEGLDVTHTGLAFALADGRFGLLHASPNGGVIVSDDLAAYVAGNASQIGIMVARPMDPRATAR